MKALAIRKVVVCELSLPRPHALYLELEFPRDLTSQLLGLRRGSSSSERFRGDGVGSYDGTVRVDTRRRCSTATPFGCPVEPDV